MCVANAGSDSVLDIDTAGSVVVASVAVGISPGGIAVNAAGTRVCVADSGSNSVTVIDTSTNTPVATVGVGVFPVACGRFVGPDAQASTASIVVPALSAWGTAALAVFLAIAGMRTASARRR